MLSWPLFNELKVVKIIANKEIKYNKCGKKASRLKVFVSPVFKKIHLSHIMCHLSHVACYMSHVKCHICAQKVPLSSDFLLNPSLSQDILIPIVRAMNIETYF